MAESLSSNESEKSKSSSLALLIFETEQDGIKNVFQELKNKTKLTVCILSIRPFLLQ